MKTNDRKAEPINAKNFMEFFEKELGAVFIDSTTGRRALDIIAESDAQAQQSCGSCEYAACGDGELTHIDDLVCVSAGSPKACDFVSADDCGCEYWTTRTPE